MELGAGAVGAVVESVGGDEDEMAEAEAEEAAGTNGAGPGPAQGVLGEASDVELGAGAVGAVVESVGGTEDEMAEAEAEEAAGTNGVRADGANPAQRLLRRAMAQQVRRRRLARTATWTKGPIHKVNNLADCVINNKAVGVTWPYLNGTQFWSAAEAIGAMNLPTLTTTAVAAGGFEAQVATVPTNTGSFDETVLAKGPWRLNTTMAAVTASGVALPAACNVGGNTRFRAYGNPSDSHMCDANRRHEDHHATDHKKAFNASIKPWDTKLRAALKKKRKFAGASAADAEAALWAAMGGTPDEVATAFYDGCQAGVDTYHGSAKGGPVGAPTSPGARNTCAISWAKYKNPS